MRFIDVLLAFACTLWISAAIAAEPTALDLEMRDLLVTINALEADYYSEHGEYGYFNELELPELDATVDNASIAFLDCRGIALWLDENGEHYLLITVGDTWLFTSLEDQSTTDGALSVLDEELTTVMDRISDAQSVYVEKHGEFILLAELCSVGLLPDSYYPLNDVFETEVAMPVPGLLISMDLDDFGGYSTGGFSDWRQVFCGESDDLATLQLIGKESAALAEGAIREHARNTMRTVISAEAAWYASHGNYGMFPEMAAERYLEERFSAATAILKFGIVIEITVADDGQSYDAIASIDGVPAFSASDMGVIVEIPPIEDDYSAEDDVTAIERAKDAMRYIVSGEAAWYAWHGYYDTLPELVRENLLDERFSNTDERFGDTSAALGHGITAEMFVADDGQSYYARVLIDDVPAFSADETGQIVEVSLYEIARDGLRWIVMAEAARYAATGAYDTLPKLVAANYLDERFGEVPATFGRSVAEVTVAEDGQSYDAMTLIDGVPAFSVNEKRNIIELPHDEAAIKELARKDLETVIAAEAAWWVTHGSYSMFPEMIAERFLAERFINEPPAILDHGIVIEVAVAEDGQTYDAILSIDGVPAYSADETGQIVEIVGDGGSDSE